MFQQKNSQHVLVVHLLPSVFQVVVGGLDVYAARENAHHVDVPVGLLRVCEVVLLKTFDHIAPSPSSDSARTACY